jgi:hypothetical protein
MKKVMPIIFVFLLIGFLFAMPGCSKTKEAVNIITEYQIGDEHIVLEQVSVLSGKVDLYIPNSFSIMSDEMLKTKYPSKMRPPLVFTNESASINVTIQCTENKVMNSLMEPYMEKMKESLNELLPTAEWYDSYIQEIDNKNVGFLELKTQAIDTDIYNLMCGVELDGKFSIISFNCTIEQMEDWKPIAKNIMDSMRFND